jgi:hypothetical protein
MILVEAKVVDSTHLELARPIAADKGRTVFVSVAESRERDSERQQWLTASGNALSAAYGESEPDYKLFMVKESNLDYEV